MFGCARLSEVLPIEDSSGVPRWTSGRESWVFRAETPEELCGYHPQLIGSALAPSEPLLYLLYSPIFEGQGGPFRVGGAPGSHAIAITPGRFLVSRDPHVPGEPRSVVAIDLAAVSSVEVGRALALGWFVIRFSGAHDTRSCPVLFSARGIHHFREVVRTYRRLGAPPRLASEAELDWPDPWKDVPTYLRTEVEPLTDHVERPRVVLRSPERWTTEKRRRHGGPVCASATGLLVATPRGLIWAASQPRMRPGELSFGVNVTLVRADRVRDATIRTRGTLGVLGLQVGAGPQPHELEVTFDGEDVSSAEAIIRLTRAWRGSL